ncbi:hypothetical protein FB451DRAFT_450903 [Mycena latifolia]|nr:hypothetical protein FB451DRAFT_450903 [Mycena latifolia]
MARTKKLVVGTPIRRSPRKHSEAAEPKKTKKTRANAEPELGTIPWAANGGALIWALLAKLQVKENRLVLFGKNPGTNEGTRGDSKIAVYKRIGRDILPDSYKTSPNALAKRVKSRAEDLILTYKTHAKKLQVTGGGLQNDDSIEEDDTHQFLECYISPEGPDHDTSPRAQNLWEEITQKFPYFPEMHKFLAARSNITPPAVTTGVGPNGRRIVHLQAPDVPRIINNP